MEFIKNYITEILTAIAGVSAWLFERKKRHQEIQSTNDKHQQHIVDMYQEALTDLKTRYDSKFLELESELQLLRKNLDLWKGK